MGTRTKAYTRRLARLAELNGIAGVWSGITGSILQAESLQALHFLYRQSVLPQGDWPNDQLNRDIKVKPHSKRVGFAFVVKLTERLSARLDLGIPVVRYAGLGNDARLHFGLQSTLF